MNKPLDKRPATDAKRELEGQNPFQAPVTAPEPKPIDRAALRTDKSVQAQDFLRVSLAMKAFGGILLLPTLFLLLIWPLVGLVFLLVAVAFIAVGFGLDAFKPWAWTAAVLLAVPFSLLGALLAIALNVLTINHVVAEVAWAAFVLPAAAAYIAWTLLSRSGRARYRSVIEAKRRQAARPRWTPPVEEIFDPTIDADAAGENTSA